VTSKPSPICWTTKIVLIDDGNIITKQEFLKTIKPANSAEQQVSPESISVMVHGNSAIATGIFQVKDGTKGRPNRSRAPSRKAAKKYSHGVSRGNGIADDAAPQGRKSNTLPFKSFVILSGANQTAKRFGSQSRRTPCLL
jgi:hypothetical protein